MTQFLSNNDLQFLIDNIEGTGKIHVSSRVLDENNTKAEWKVHYGDGDSRNKKGIILGEFALQKADLTGVQKVLEQVNNGKIVKKVKKNFLCFPNFSMRN